MELINKNNATIQKFDSRNAEPRFCVGRKLRFNRAAVKAWNLVAGSYVHFMYDMDRLYFYTNDDKAGFKLSNESQGRVAFMSAPLLKTLAAKFPYKVTVGSSYSIKKLSSRINDEEVYEVIIASKKVNPKKWEHVREKLKLKTA